MSKRVFAAFKDWIVQQIPHLFLREDSGTDDQDYQLNDDSGVIKVGPNVDEDSFVAGMKACDELHQMRHAETAQVPLYNDALKDVPEVD